MSHMDRICPGPETLALWVDGELLPEDRADVAAHLAGCDDCRRTVALASTLEPAPAGEVDELLLARVVSASRRRSLWPYAAAAGLLVALGISAWLLKSPEPPAPVVQTVPPAPAPVAKAPPVEPAPPVVPAPPPLTEQNPVAIPAPEKPKETPKPEPPKPAEPKPLVLEPTQPKPTPEPAPAVKEPPKPTETNYELVFTPVFVIDPSGDLWLKRGATEPARVGGFERVGWKDSFATRNAGAAFNLESRAAVILEKGAEAGVSYFKPEAAYRLSLGQGVVMVDTDGATQKWQIGFGHTEINFSSLNGRLAVEPRGAMLAAVLLEGRGEVRIGSEFRRIQPGREVVLTPEGKVSENRAETARRIARLTELRPKVSTAFAANFDEKKDEVHPFPYALVAGRLVTGPTGYYLQAESALAKSGEKGLLLAALKPDRPFEAASGMVLRFRYRIGGPGITINLGKYSAEFTSRIKAGQWGEGEVPLETFFFEGTPLLPTVPIEDVRFSALSDKKAVQLDVDGVQFLKRR